MVKSKILLVWELSGVRLGWQEHMLQCTTVLWSNICDKALTSIFWDQVRTIERVREIPHEGSFCDLMWSDPEDMETWSISPRGAGWLFGSKVTAEFNHINGLSLICRAHQLVQEGIKFMFEGRPCYSLRIPHPVIHLVVSANISCFRFIPPDLYASSPYRGNKTFDEHEDLQLWRQLPWLKYHNLWQKRQAYEIEASTFPCREKSCDGVVSTKLLLQMWECCQHSCFWRQSSADCEVFHRNRRKYQHDCSTKCCAILYLIWYGIGVFNFDKARMALPSSIAL